jgi:hypothetical protein
MEEKHEHIYNSTVRASFILLYNHCPQTPIKAGLHNCKKDSKADTV